MSDPEPPPELLDRLARDFPTSARERIGELIEKGWSRTGVTSPMTHRVAATERFVRLALRENEEPAASPDA